ncbi:MAG: sodium:solute symporter family transporter, partial [Candidatus Kapaibacteriota bacterium]
IIGTVICFIYIGYGGFKTNVITNSIQFVLMYLGFGIFTFFSLQEIGYELFRLQKLPQTHLKFFGDLNWQYTVSWVFISLQTFIDPSFYQRCTSAKNGKTARNGILVSILFWIAFDTMTIFVGLVAKLFLSQINPLFAFPLLLEKIVPPVFKGIVFISMLATIISTLESYTFLSAILIGKNLFQSIKFFSNISLEKRVRIGVIITGIFSIGLANFIPSAIDLIYRTSSVAVPSLFFPVILSYIRKPILKIKQVNFLIITSTILTIIFMISKEINFTSELINSNILMHIEPMVFGFLWASLCFLTMVLYNKFKKTFTTNIRA